MGRSADQERVGPIDQRNVDDAGCRFLHVDMDSFFVSVEVRRDPRLRGKPVIVGGADGWGVVSSASYEARAYGVRSAMSMAQALRLCPHAIVLGGRHDEYGAVSADVMSILRSFTPLVQPLSLDEAFLDVDGAQRLLGSPRTIAQAVRQRVKDELDLTCSVGVASRMFVAKIASTRCKPDGMLIVPDADTTEFLRPLPVSALWGVGPKSARKLEALGLMTIGDIADARKQTLVSNLGKAQAAHLAAMAAGHDPRRVTPERVDKSMSAESTYFHTLTGHAQIETEIGRLAHKVARRLRAKSFEARTIGIKVRSADFVTHTRDITTNQPTDVARVIAGFALDQWRALERGTLDGRAIRLLGVRAGGLLDAGSVPVQLRLEDVADQPPLDERWSAAERALDAVVAKFGGGAIKPASTIASPVRDEPPTDIPDSGY